MKYPVSPHRGLYRNPGAVMAAASLAGFLTACGGNHGAEPVIRTVEVRVPVAVACVPAGTPTAPPARATLPAETGPMIRAMAAELIERRAYDDQVAPVVAACRTPAAH